MAKLKHDTITSAMLEHYLTTNDNFGFEIACFRKLHKTSVLNIEHAGTYSDPITNKSRQFDFRVRCSPTDNLRISAAIECKNLRANFPLLISRLPRLKAEAFHELLVPAPIDDAESQGGIYEVSLLPNRRLNPSSTTRLRAPQTPYAVGEMVGKATAQVGVMPNGESFSDDSEVYEKWAQAVSSTYDLLSTANETFADDEDLALSYFIVPVVVVPDGMLWVKDYYVDGTSAGPPTQVNETSFFLNHSFSGKAFTFSYVISHLHFVTLTGLGSFFGRHLVNTKFQELLVSRANA